MKYNDIEKELSNFTFKEPEHNLKVQVLRKARTVWTEKRPVTVFTFRLLRNYAYGLAMLLLISIVSSKIDISLTDRLIDGKTTLVAKTIKKNNNLEEICSDLGINCKTYKLLATMAKIEEDENKSNIFNQRDKLMEEFNLINGGLSMSKGKKALKVIGIILGSLIALIIVVHIILNIVFGIQLRNKIAELKAQGRPMTIAEIVPSPVPDKDNAAILYNKAFALMGSTEGSISETIKTIDFSDISQWTDEQKQQISKIVNSRDAQYIYELLEEGSRKPKCNFNHEYEKGPLMPLPELTPMRNAVRLLCAKAVLEAESGKTTEAFDTLLIGLKISNHLKNGLTLIEQLVRIACDGIIIKSIEYISDSNGIIQEKADSIMEELSTHEGVEPFIKSMDGERVCMGIWAFERILRGKPQELRELIDATSPSSMSLAMIISFLGKPIFKKDFTCYLTLMSKVQDNYNLPYYKVAQEIPLEQQIQRLPKYFYPLTNILMPALDRVQMLAAEHPADIDVCRIGIALKLYKAKNGNYPEKLESLVPEFLKEVPIDPFSGESLKYSSYGKGFKLYSIGPNMQDDFGTPKAKKENEPAYKDYDIVWESNS